MSKVAWSWKSKPVLLSSELLAGTLLEDSAIEVVVDAVTADEVDLVVDSDGSIGKVVASPDKAEVPVVVRVSCSDDSAALGGSEEVEVAKKEKRASNPELDEVVAAELGVDEREADVSVEVSLEKDEKVELVLCLVAGSVNANTADEDGECGIVCTESVDSNSVTMESSVV
ncbi:hypothetical protein IWW36_003518 [Coemansia brasiliensis]|uniref:Uncharacterized protein n=1 Tax=Coemansia brasiliensis TaxID=2650707 RepID=A0A9W8ICM3_9FUNG|nr:hypothetical protein IWW36_003518 [Coemansia brasiliensis]